MAGSYNLFDGQQLTAASEYDSRYGTKVDTLQIHHATMTSLSGLVGLMMPGGRQVSANGAMGNDGHLLEVVPATHRAFTSASSYDRRSLTVECCNTTLAPEWGISDATHRRLGKLAADMYRAGLLGGIDRNYIIGHNETPGSYATACPGPSMNLDLVVQYARGYVTAGGGATPFPTEGDTVLSFIHINSGANNDMFVVGQRLVLDHSTGILRALYDGEYALLEATNPGISWAQWSPDVAKTYVARGGLRAYEVPAGAPAGAVGKLTGEIIFSAKDRRYPLTQSVNPGTGGAVDVTKIAAAAKEGAEAGVKTLKVPTAVENGAAARAAIVK